MKIACVQADVVFGDPSANAATVLRNLTQLREQGVELAVFPEAFLTGYCVSCIEDAERIALDLSCSSDGEIEEIPEALSTIQNGCITLGLHSVVGFAGRQGGRVFNGAILFEPSGRMRRYVKTHLPDLGLDKFVSAGGDLPVFETVLGRIGILICYDLRPPEAARVLALNGADLIVLPTNWPVGAETSAEHISIARAAENKVFLATCNRTGEEHGFKFIGRSKIIDPSGKVLAAAGDGEEVLIADLNLELARSKRTVNIPGKYELDVFGSRRPELYSRVVQLS